MRSERLAAVAVGRSPGLEGERQKLLLGGREAGRRAFLVEPACGLSAVPLDLPRQLVADGA